MPVETLTREAALAALVEYNCYLGGLTCPDCKPGWVKATISDEYGEGGEVCATLTVDGCCLPMREMGAIAARRFFEPIAKRMTLLERS